MTNLTQRFNFLYISPNYLSFYLKGGEKMKRINADERMVIQAYLIKGCSISEIAK